MKLVNGDNARSSIFVEPISSITYNSRLMSDPAAAIYNRDVQILSTLKFSSRHSPPTSLLPSSLLSSQDMSSVKKVLSSTENEQPNITTIDGEGTYLPFISSNSTPAMSCNTSNSFVSNREISSLPYSSLCKHFLFNTSLICTQSLPVSETLSSCTTVMENIFGQKIRESVFSSNIINNKICSELNNECLNNDNNTLDISITKSQSSKIIGTESFSSVDKATKRNPYSIDELLKKPEKKIRSTEPFAYQHII